jgi:uncharacterized MAPEG superfamily protein
MIVAFWCVLIAGVLPIFCSYLAKFVRGADDGEPVLRFDNRDPRGWLARQGGARSRANAAQQNSFEAFPFFAVGVVIAVLQHVPVATIDTIAIVFIVARLFYVAFYVGNLASLRSLAWLVGFAASVTLYFVAATGTLR